MTDAIVLCSGGLDSVVAAHYARKILKYKKITILFFNYRQRTLLAERYFSKICAKEINANWIEVDLNDLEKLSPSRLTGKERASRILRGQLKNTKKESNKWYVPFRNGIFLSYALSLAESIYIRDKKINNILVGFKSEGKESYPDTTQSFIDSINYLSSISLSKSFKLIAPFIKKDKEDIIQIGRRLNVDFRNTFSCYVNNRKHCGICLACMLRKEGFYWANERDTTEYIE